MIERRCRTRLEHESLHSGLIFQEIRRKEFQRHFAAQGEILGLIDHSHPAAAQLAGDAIVRDGLVQHRWRKAGG